MLFLYFLSVVSPRHLNAEIHRLHDWLDKFEVDIVAVQSQMGHIRQPSESKAKAIQIGDQDKNIASSATVTIQNVKFVCGTTSGDAEYACIYIIGGESSNVAITGCTFTLCDGGQLESGVSVKSKGTVSITGCTFAGGMNRGILVDEVGCWDNFAVTGNTITGYKKYGVRVGADVGLGRYQTAETLTLYLNESNTISTTYADAYSVKIGSSASSN